MNPLGGGHGPLMRVLFGENVCKNERIGSRSVGVRRKFLYVDPPLVLFLFSLSLNMNIYLSVTTLKTKI